MQKRTRFDHAVTTEKGVHFRVAKEVYDGDRLVSSEWHRGTLSDHTAVNEHLGRMGFPPLPADAIRVPKNRKA